MANKNELYIIGTRGLAKEIALLARSIDPGASIWPCIHYVAQDAAELGQERPFGLVDTLDDALADPKTKADVAIGVGHPSLRRRIAISLRQYPHLGFPNLIHPRVEIDPTLVKLGIGNAITQGVILTCDIQLEDFNLLNLNTTIGHDCRVGSYNVINPGCSISGNVVMGDACLIGTGARILEGRQIADDTTLGAGAVLTRTIMEPGCTYVGIPARIVSS